MQELGLDTGYRCRECKKGSGFESLHFGKKKHGRLPDTVPVHDRKMLEEDFTPANLSRRMSTSVDVRVWDPCGKLAPVADKD